MSEPESIELPAASPGTRRSLQLRRYGTPGARPKAYLQAALHADEIPGLLVQRQLARRLERAAAAGEVRGEVLLVPQANPIGSAQHLFGRLQGRYEQSGGINFNRGYPDLAAAVAARIEGRLGDDPRTNVACVRAAALAALGAPPADEAGFLKHTLLGLALDADIVLDLHCDWDAVLHLYTASSLWPQAADLAAQLGVRATLLADDSGGNSFDEAASGLWWRLAARFAEHPIPPACLAATVELRGERDVDLQLAERDADNLYRFLQRRGVLAGDPGPLPEPAGEATPLEGVAMVAAPQAGVVSYAEPLGARVAAGGLLATLLDPLAAPDAPGVEIRSPVDGLLFARRGDRLARPGQVLCRVAGREPLPGRAGTLLLSD